MNAHHRYKRLVSNLLHLLSAHPAISKLEKPPRHAETLAAAGFGYPSNFDYLQAVTKGREHCAGLYFPDSKMIERRMINDFGYPAELLQELIWMFAKAGTNDPATKCRIDFYDYLVSPQQSLSEKRDHTNHETMKRTIIDALDDENRQIRQWFWRYVRNDNPEDYFSYDIKIPLDFPSSYYLGRTINFPLTVSYDLDLGSDVEASFFKYNRQLSFSGNVRIKPSGRRGWHYPTSKLDPHPIRDERIDSERLMEPYVFPGEDLDQDEYESGRDAARAEAPIPSDKTNSLSWLAGYVMLGKNCNAAGHMSTGRAFDAFHEALAYAESLDLFDPLRIAAEGCRQLASTRSTKKLEEAIADEISERLEL